MPSARVSRFLAFFAVLVFAWSFSETVFAQKAGSHSRSPSHSRTVVDTNLIQNFRLEASALHRSRKPRFSVKTGGAANASIRLELQVFRLGPKARLDKIHTLVLPTTGQTARSFTLPWRLSAGHYVLRMTGMIANGGESSRTLYLTVSRSGNHIWDTGVLTPVESVTVKDYQPDPAPGGGGNLPRASSIAAGKPFGVEVETDGIVSSSDGGLENDYATLQFTIYKSSSGGFPVGGPLGHRETKLFDNHHTHSYNGNSAFYATKDLTKDGEPLDQGKTYVLDVYRVHDIYAHNGHKPQHVHTTFDVTP